MIKIDNPSLKIPKLNVLASKSGYKKTEEKGKFETGLSITAFCDEGDFRISSVMGKLSLGESSLYIGATVMCEGIIIEIGTI